MVYSLSYRRPERASRPETPSSISSEHKQKSIHESVRSSGSGMSNGIPEALSFDTIIAGGACPPCTVRDFMNFLKYIELSAENLQFFLWYRDYVKRFDNLPETEKILSPEWTGEKNIGEALKNPRAFNADAAAILKGTDFANEGKPTESEKGASNPFFTPPRTPTSLEQRRDDYSIDSFDGSVGVGKVDHTQRAAGAFDSAGLKWKPLSVQPYREEIDRIISIYIADNGSRQLNLSSKERTGLLHALQNTTHPSAFAEVITTVEWSLRCQAHPNFVRWTICNGNRARVIFARGLGLFGIAAGLIVAIILTLSSAGRAWRIISMIGFFIGISTLIAAWKGMCVVLHGMHHRHVRPWELFTSDDEQQAYDFKSDSFNSVDSHSSSNSWEDEPWVARYEKRNVVRKIFDREVWIQEPALRQIQDTIFLQAILGALIISAVAVGIFCAIPQGNFF
ncbi:RGS domain-containing protein [Pyrenophora tritici-repentis]|nr:RGS domain-containing protein [Pyrenophora tritici-repentis]KAI0607506.1 RGS domain-containing protein [Pyrenophora tritici-repentis]KAI0619719.1 RGS domain-containing protein [Pyrenophora tritici-repentis]